MKLKRSYPTIPKLGKWLDQLLSVATIKDSALNGLQVMGQRVVRRIALAVDAAAATIQAAQAAQADLLLVHHGIFWGQVEPCIGYRYQRMRALIESGLGLYACHLPLDRHPRLGNNIILAHGLGLKNVQTFGTYHGIKIGFGGRLPRPLALEQLSRRLAQIIGHNPKQFAFGKSQVQRIAIVSGGAGDIAEEAAAEGYEVYITGEVSHQIIHPCKENGLNLLLGGHYATETLGLKALGKYIQKKLGIPCIFIDFPTGL